MTSNYMHTQMRRTLTLLVIIALTLGLLLWGNKALQTSTYTVTSTQLPQEFEGYTIAQVSDLHNAEFGDGNQKLLDRIREANPNIIVLTGDLVDSHKTDTALALNFARQASTIAPTYYITGNHEAWLGEGLDLFLTQLAAAGVTILRDQATDLHYQGASITLAGLDDPDAATQPTAQRLQPLVNPQDYEILLAHRPEDIQLYASAGADLVLSGHAHGGQIRLPIVGGLVAPGQGFLPTYDAGTYREGTTTMVVSRGLGNSLVPLRINNRPELVVITLGKD